MDREEYERKEEARWAGGVMESCHNGREGVRIQVFARPELMERLRARTDFDNKDPVKEVVDSVMYDAREKIYQALQTADVMLDPETEKQAAAKKAAFQKAFEDAGLGPIYMEQVANEYWKDRPWSLSSPWFIVTTRLGHFKIGWRKRVIELDWTRTTVRKGALDEIGQADNTTHGPQDIHAWGYEKLTQYLKALAS